MNANDIVNTVHSLNKREESLWDFRLDFFTSEIKRKIESAFYSDNYVDYLKARQLVIFIQGITHYNLFDIKVVPVFCKILEDEKNLAYFIPIASYLEDDSNSWMELLSYDKQDLISPSYLKKFIELLEVKGGFNIFYCTDLNILTLTVDL